MKLYSRKKQRGQHRRLNVLLKNIDELTPFQNTDLPCEHFHVPGSVFIQHAKTPGKVKTAFCRRWIRKAEEIMVQKPENLLFCKVVAVIDDPHFWSSQIIIFYDKEYYDVFWNRKGPEQSWEPIQNEELSFAKERNIITALLEKGYAETICDDEGYMEKSVLWFYGDI